MANKDYTASPCLIFFRKSILEINNLMFYEGIIQEDELFTFQLFIHCNRVKIINETFFHRRLRPESTMTGSNYFRSFIGYSIVLKEMLKLEKKVKGIVMIHF